MEKIIAFRKPKPLLHLFINMPELTIQKRFIAKPKKKKLPRPKFEFKKEFMDSRIKKFSELILNDNRITLDHILSNSRNSEIVKMRHLIIWMLTEHTPITISAIAKSFNRNHSTVIHARESVRDQIKYDPKYPAFVKKYENILTENEQVINNLR